MVSYPKVNVAQSVKELGLQGDRMRAKTPLKTKTPLKAKTKLKANKIPKRQIKPSKVKLRKEADRLFSRAVRLRDSELVDGVYQGECITCSYSGIVAYLDDKDILRFARGWDAGHYIGRGKYITRWDEENVNLQCSYRCNRMRSGELAKYKLALDAKYGLDTSVKLEKLAKTHADHSSTIKEINQVIADAREEIAFYEKQLRS